MIMQRIDSDDDNQRVPVHGSGNPEIDGTTIGTVPGFMYRCVPQDKQRLILRMDTRRNIGEEATRPAFLSACRIPREASRGELFLG